MRGIGGRLTPRCLDERLMGVRGYEGSTVGLRPRLCGKFPNNVWSVREGERDDHCWTRQ